MKVIRANCQSQFTAADLEFLRAVLDKGNEAAFLDKLLRDPESLDLLLDDRRLFRAVVDMRGCLRVSLHFYFYVLVRHAMLQEGVLDREVADYVACLLAVFARAQRMRRPLDGEPLDYLVDMIKAQQEADPEKRFLLQTHVGNYSLFVAGLFPRHVEHRIRRKAAPGFGYYEQLGSAQFRVASDHFLAHRYSLSALFMALSESFHSLRLALNAVSERMVFLEEVPAAERLWREAELGGPGPAS